jgi:hypothetical protein
MKPLTMTQTVRRRVAGVLLMAVVVVCVTGAAAPSSLDQVINNLRSWLVGMLVAIATLMATVGGLRYLLAGGDPGEVAKAKNTLRFAAIGYGIAALAPLLVKVLKGIVGA